MVDIMLRRLEQRGALGASATDGALSTTQQLAMGLTITPQGGYTDRQDQK
jgi:hypothetical protein